MKSRLAKEECGNIAKKSVSLLRIEVTGGCSRSCPVEKGTGCKSRAVPAAVSPLQESRIRKPLSLRGREGAAQDKPEDLPHYNPTSSSRGQDAKERKNEDSAIFGNCRRLAAAGGVVATGLPGCSTVCRKFP